MSLEFRKSLHFLLRRFGVDVVRYSRENSVLLRRAVILKLKAITAVLDVGANQGDYAMQIRESGYSGRIVSFEPLKEAFSRLNKRSHNDPKWTCMNVGVGDCDGTMELNVSGHETSSSFLDLSVFHASALPSSRYVSKQTVNMVRLDSIAPSFLTANDRIFLKADVQGFERKVLDGAAETLRQTYAVELELSLVPLYSGSQDVVEMVSFLKGNQFRLVSIERVFSDPETGFWLQMDGIFLKDSANSTADRVTMV